MKTAQEIQHETTKAAESLFLKNHPEYGVMALVPSNIEWAPKSAPMALKFNGTSCEAVRTALFNTFGKFPLQLNRFEHETVLVGMMNAAGEGATPYKILRDALAQFGEIEVRLA